MVNITLNKFKGFYSALLKINLLFVLAAIIAFSASQSSAATPHKDKVIVLVAGFFNSFAPEYFSDDIIETLKSKGFKVIVAEKLNPVGTIEDNGERVLRIFNAVRSENPNADITALGHSAGGLYTLYAINKGAHYIKNLITVSTPFDGVEFIERLRDQSEIIKDLTDLCFLDGLRQLTKPFVRNFLATIKVPSSLKVYAFGGYQPVSLNIFDSANMSAVLSVTDSYITGKSDGIVGYGSATASALIPTLDKTTIKVNTNTESVLRLEHWEQVLDYRNFILLGTPNIELIQNRQIKFYSSIADLMLTL